MSRPSLRELWESSCREAAEFPNPAYQPKAVRIFQFGRLATSWDYSQKEIDSFVVQKHQAGASYGPIYH